MIANDQSTFGDIAEGVNFAVDELEKALLFLNAEEFALIAKINSVHSEHSLICRPWKPFLTDVGNGEKVASSTSPAMKGVMSSRVKAIAVWKFLITGINL